MRPFSWCALVALCLGPTAYGSTISITDNPVSINDTAGTDYLLWKQVGSTLINDNSVTLASVLSGLKTQAAPGGNVRTFASSDTTDIATFQTSPHTVVTGTLNGHSVAISSLNGADWFTEPGNIHSTAYGVPTLANQWFTGFLSFYSFDAVASGAGFTPLQVAGLKVKLFNDFVNGGNFQHLSGPSVSYVHEDSVTDQVTVGLADTNALFSGIAGYLTSQGDSSLIPLIPTNVEASKVVLVSFDGQPGVVLDSFSGIPSGLSTTDGTNSFNLEFEVSTPGPSGIPEPASLALVCGAVPLLLARRRRNR